MKSWIAIGLLLASITTAHAGPLIEQYIDQACGTGTECRHMIARYRMVKLSTHTRDSCTEATRVKRYFLSKMDDLNYRMWAAISDVECQLIGLPRPETEQR
jgi:hypothetical protein